MINKDKGPKPTHETNKPEQIKPEPPAHEPKTDHVNGGNGDVLVGAISGGVLGGIFGGRLGAALGAAAGAVLGDTNKKK